MAAQTQERCILLKTLFMVIFLQIQPSFTQQPCISDEFQCQDYSKCIPDAWKCDNVDDCDDLSDESALTCCDDVNDFHCERRACIPQTDVCNGASNCATGKDELNCQLPAEIDQCLSKPCVNGYCVHDVNGYTCLCHVGCTGTNCDSCSDMIFVTDIGGSQHQRVPIPKIWAGPIDTFGLEEIPVQNLGRPVAIDFDPIEQKVYWSDVETETINRAYINGSNQEVIASSLSVPDGLALDINNRWLFWTDAGSDKIEQANLDGTGRHVIIGENLDEPRAIVSDMDNSRLFWTDWGVSPMIERANMDGSQRVALITEDIFLPNGLTIDFTGKVLYWCDAYLNRIERADLNGQGRVNMGTITNVDIHPFDIGFYKDALYWSDWSLSSLVKMHSYSRENPSTVGPAIFKQAGGLHIFKQDINKCSSNSCVHGLCVDGVNAYSCQCYAGWTGNDCNIDVNECSSSPCAHGQCVDGVNEYNCQCDAGWLGSDCDHNIDECGSSPCKNGQCFDGINQYTCQCYAGWIGENCDNRLDACASDPCANGYCLDGVNVNGYICRCDAGWTGTNCDEDVNECSSSPCAHGQCADGVNGYTCQCDAGWSGIHCYTNIDECGSSPCIHGQCFDGINQYICQCYAGWTGENCENILNIIDECISSPCIHGHCLDGINQYTCHCYAGWTGQNCDNILDACAINPCDHGYCLDGVNVNGYICRCDAGWTGTNCDEDFDECVSSPCEHGRCVNGINQYTCQCYAGWTGKNCDNILDACASDPCAHGYCLDGVNVNGYICRCDAGWTGTKCDEDIDDCRSSSCVYGQCVDGIDQYTCLCYAGWTGENCDSRLDIDECISSPCENGQCFDGINQYTCQCYAGWTGENCDNRLDFDECGSSPCVHGQCLNGINQYTCQCYAGWTGENCDNMDACASNPCDHGYCLDGVNVDGYICRCDAGWTGTNCDEEACASDPCAHGYCQNGVSLNGYICWCDAGWTGIDCDEDIDECSSYPCINGQCLDAINQYQCQCHAGWTGTHCDNQDILECNSNSCVNGVCVDGANNYICQCDNGWIGYNCDIQVTCPVRQPPLNGMVEPSICQFLPSYPGLTCRYSCNDVRSVLNGPQSQTCLATGTWSDEGVTSSCEEDNTPPTFQTECPLDLMHVTVQKPCLDEIALYVNLPTPTDNSVYSPQVVPRIPYDTRLSIGRHERLFRAFDTAGNVAECLVFFHVSKLMCESLPPTPINGYIDTTSCDDFYNNVTTYKCNDGYRLVGESKLTCGGDGKWRPNEAPSCKEIRCDALTIPANGRVFPSDCRGKSVPLGEECSIICNPGYTLGGSKMYMNCTQDGTKGRWTGDSTGAVCQDLSAPEFITCPESITVNLPADLSEARVTWPTPTASHLGQPVPAVPTGLTSPALLELGNYRVVYRAHNPYDGETGYCVFNVSVSDIHAPTTLNCPTEPITIVSSGIPVVVTWAEPRFTDNVGVSTLTKRYTDSSGKSYPITTLPFLLYYYEPVTVIYTALDETGNTAECSFEVQPTNSTKCNCPTMIDPPNSVLTCEASDCMNCSIYCTSGHVQLNTRFSNAECQTGGVKPGKPPTKDGVVPGKPPIKDGGVAEGKNVDRNPQMAACATVDASNTMNVSRIDIIVVSGPAEEDCSQQLSDNMKNTMTEGANAMFQPKCQNDPMSTCKVSIDVQCPDKSDSKRTKRQSERGMKLKVKCRLTAERSNSDDISVVETAMSTPVSELMPTGRVVMQNQNGQYYIFDVESVERGPVKANCGYRQGAAGMRCVPCPVGTSYDLVTRDCIPCGIGKYQDEEGWLVCKPCPEGYSTSGTGSYDVAHCQAACVPGQYAFRGLQPCNPCPIGTYQPKVGERGCEPCPDGKTTSFIGTTSVLQCWG